MGYRSHPIHGVYTRLAEGRLADLDPSPDYGRILPYVGKKASGAMVPSIPFTARNGLWMFVTRSRL
jgi:hypothetical protein